MSLNPSDRDPGHTGKMAKGTAPVLSIIDGVAMANEIILPRLLKFAVLGSCATLGWRFETRHRVEPCGQGKQVWESGILLVMPQGAAAAIAEASARTI